MLMKEIFPLRLRALREAIGVSQEDFSKAIGITRPTLSYYEGGNRTPDIDVLARIHDVTGCSLSYLLGFSDTMKEEYAPLGEITAMNDPAIENIRRSNPHVINFVLGHQDFPRIMNLMEIYANIDTREDYALPMVSDKAYARYAVSKLFETILIGYASDNAPPEEKIEENTEGQTAFIKEYIKEHRAYLDAIQKQERLKREQDEEQAGTDPICRFKLQMKNKTPTQTEQDEI